MNELFKNEIYIHMIILLIIFLYTLLIAAYILFNDEYNIFIRIISIFVIAIIIFLASKKETFLPFLGLTFIPNTLLCEPKFPNGANLNYTLDMHDYEDGTKIIYWAANNETDSLKIIEDPFSAYKNFNNVGVSVVKKGKADVRIFCPNKYKVKKVFDKILERHFHYRIIFKDNGFLSPVMTVNIKC
jgi:hypothetical protein